MLFKQGLLMGSPVCVVTNDTDWGRADLASGNKGQVQQWHICCLGKHAGCIHCKLQRMPLYQLHWWTQRSGSTLVRTRKSNYNVLILCYQKWENGVSRNQ